MLLLLELVLVTSAAVIEEKVTEDTSEVCYDHLGCFSNEYPWDCFHSRQLPDNPVTMEFEYRRYINENNYEELDYRLVQMNVGPFCFVELGL